MNPARCRTDKDFLPFRVCLFVPLSPLLYRWFAILQSLVCQLLTLCPEQPDSCFQSLKLCQSLAVCFLLFPLPLCGILGFTFKALVQLEQIYKVRDEDLADFSYTLHTIFPSTLVKEAVFSLVSPLCHLCQKPGDYNCVDLNLGPLFSDIDLHVCL